MPGQIGTNEFLPQPVRLAGSERHRAISGLYGIFRDAVVSILAVVAKQERLRRSERVKASIERRRPLGIHFGPKVRIDYAKARKVRASGMSYWSIARELGISVGAAFKAAKS